MLGQTGMRIGTLPRNVIPNVTSVIIPSSSASATYHQFASFTEAQNSPGSPMRVKRNPIARSAATAMSRLRGWIR
jgi:hypothetical protein